MGTTIVNLRGPEPPSRVYDAVRKEFEGLSLLIVYFTEGRKGICASSLESALPGLNSDATWGKCYRTAPQVSIRVFGGKAFPDRVIEDALFYGLMIGLPGWNDIKKKATAVLTNLDRGIPAVPEDVNSPLVQSLRSQLELAIAQERQGKQIQRLNERADDSQNQIEDLRDMVTYRKDRQFTIAGLGFRGWTFPNPELRKKVGTEMAVIAKSANDVPPKAPSGRFNENLHLESTFNSWEKREGPKYKAEFYDNKRDKYRYP